MHSGAGPWRLRQSHSRWITSSNILSPKKTVTGYRDAQAHRQPCCRMALHAGSNQTPSPLPVPPPSPQGSVFSCDTRWPGTLCHLAKSLRCLRSACLLPSVYHIKDNKGQMTRWPTEDRSGKHHSNSGGEGDGAHWETTHDILLGTVSQFKFLLQGKSHLGKGRGKTDPAIIKRMSWAEANGPGDARL